METIVNNGRNAWRNDTSEKRSKDQQDQVYRLTSEKVKNASVRILSQDVTVRTLNYVVFR